jgi:dienelactone hydrolase
MHSLRRFAPLAATVAGALLLLPAALRAADCPATPTAYKATFVTYFEKADQPATSTDPRCSMVRVGGKDVCRIRLRGLLYEPKKAPPAGNPYPAIVYNHGSERGVFTSSVNARCVPTFFVSKGYVVLFPFRRGHGETADSDGETTVAANTSTGLYFGDALDLFQLNPLIPPVVAPLCLALFPDVDQMTQCYKAELLRAQSADAVEGFKYLRGRANVDKNAIAFMGTSYGGITSILVNQQAHGHKAIVAFAPGAQSWGNQPFVRSMLLVAATHGQQPAFFLQAKWDEDTRPTAELALAHAESAADPLHGKRFMASIYDYPKPPNDPATGSPDYSSVHGGFSRSHQYWGVAVLDFLQRYGVK